MLVLVSACFVFGALVGRYLDIALPSWCVGVAVGIGVLVGYVGLRAKARSWCVLLALAALAAGMSLPQEDRRTVAPGLARIEARVERATARGAFVRLSGGEYLERPRPLSRAARVFVAGLSAPNGARVHALVRLRPFSEFRNGVSFATGAPDGFASLQSDARVEAGAIATALHESRAALRRRLTRSLSPASAGIARALLLGEGSAVVEEDRAAFRGAGLAHLLAVSGLHVGLVVAFALLLLRRLFIRRADPMTHAAIYALPIAFGFALLAGGAPSVWRATLMVAVALVCRARKRRPRAGPTLAAAVVVFASLSPAEVLRPAFLLSIGATAAIVSGDLTGPALRVAARVSARTTLATAPLILVCFESLPLLGVLANVIVVPLAVFALVPLAYLHALACGAGMPELTGALFDQLCDAMIAVTQSFESTWDVPPLSGLQVTALVLLSLGLLLSQSWRGALSLLLAASGALAATELAVRAEGTPHGVLRATFVDVGQGDGALVDLPDGSLMLIDAAGGQPNAGEHAIVPLLRARRRSEIALAIITHPHPDHFGGVAAVAEAARLREVWVSGQALSEMPHGQAAALVRRLRRNGTRVRTPEDFCRDQNRLGGVAIDVLWPCPHFDAGFDANNNSIVVRLRYGARSILFTGDAEREAEAEFAGMDSALLRAEILKVPHHGSRTSSTDVFLDAVRPEWAIASCGRFNSFGHPHASVVARYGRRTIPFARTATEGAVVAVTDGHWWQVVSQSGRRWRWRPGVMAVRKRAHRE